MGEGFVVMQSNDVDIYYYRDEPGTTILCRILACLPGSKSPEYFYFFIPVKSLVINVLVCVLSGLVPEEQESGDPELCGEGTKLQDLPPCWGLDIVCGKGTDFNYGPWADRQRYTHTHYTTT